MVGKLFQERKKIKLELKLNPTEQKELEKNIIEEKISKATEFEYLKKVQQTLGHVTGEDGGINTNGLWKAKQNLIPKDKSSNPVALRDKKGNLITCPEGIKKLCLEEMLERLRHRPMHPNLIKLQQLKENLCNKRINIAKHIKTEPWTEDQLEKVFNSLKNGRCLTLRGS